MSPVTLNNTSKDIKWLIIWFVVISSLAVWDMLFLNTPALKQVVAGFFNTFFISFLVIIITLTLGWLTTIYLHYLRSKNKNAMYFIVTFILNLIRSIPQVVGILLGYVGVSFLMEKNILQNNLFVFILLALCMSIFVFIELADCMQDRINYYKKLDFYNAMRVCGISESRIINFDILWKNSRIHIFNKLISIFGIAVFLQCSVDFIISVGLSTDVNTITLPTTLGSLLAKIDSKQDILAIGYTLTHPTYFPNLFFGHLQGITVAFAMVFTLLSIYHISNGYAERHRL